MAWKWLDSWKQSFTNSVPSQIYVTAAPSGVMILDLLRSKPGTGVLPSCLVSLGSAPALGWPMHRPGTPFLLCCLNLIHSNFVQAVIVKQWLYMPFTCHMSTNIFLTFNIYSSQKDSGVNNAFKKTNANRIYSLSIFTQNMTNSVRSQLTCGTGDIRKSIGNLA